jgi:hypothetical protein
MAGVLPARLATRQRLALGTIIVAFVSILQIVQVDMWTFIFPWPMALLWAVCGWSGLGVSIGTSLILAALGLWVDVLTGSTLGTWAAIALITHGLTVLAARFLGTGNGGPVINCAVSGFIMICVMMFFTMWQNNGFDPLGIILPVLMAIALYVAVGRWFELSEDET